MKKFLIQTTFFLCFPVLIFLGIFILADGYTDPYYSRFATSSQHSLILGTSRAAQGLEPSTFDSVLSRDDVFNYSFTRGHSPYGPIYLESIKQKLNHSTENGVFVLTVDPWSVSSISEEPENETTFRERNLFLDDLEIVSLNPNIFYLINEYQGSYFRILINFGEKLIGKRPKPVYLHKDGWLEIKIPMDSVSVQQRKESKIVSYKKDLQDYKVSQKRIESLKKTIHFLQKHGDVFLVRLPTSTAILDIESELYPEFDLDIEMISEELGIPYMSFFNRANEFVYTDGNHLYMTSSKVVSQEVAEWIKSSQARQ